MMQSNHKVESHYFIWQLSAVTTLYCTCSPCVCFVPCLAQYSRWDTSLGYLGRGESTLIKFLLVTFEYLFYYHCLSVYGVRLTDWELHHTFINHCLLIQSLAHFDTHPPRLLTMYHMHILVRTAHSGHTPEYYELWPLPWPIRMFHPG